MRRQDKAAGTAFLVFWLICFVAGIAWLGVLIWAVIILVPWVASK